jgi:hypothetical protein
MNVSSSSWRILCMNERMNAIMYGECGIITTRELGGNDGRSGM